MFLRREFGNPVVLTTASWSPGIVLECFVTCADVEGHIHRSHFRHGRNHKAHPDCSAKKHKDGASCATVGQGDYQRAVYSLARRDFRSAAWITHVSTVSHVAIKTIEYPKMDTKRKFRRSSGFLPMRYMSLWSSVVPLFSETTESSRESSWCSVTSGSSSFLEVDMLQRRNNNTRGRRWSASQKED
jgi:hypothetical protein